MKYRCPRKLKKRLQKMGYRVEVGSFSGTIYVRDLLGRWFQISRPRRKS